MKKVSKIAGSLGVAVAIATAPVLIRGKVAKEGEYPHIVRITSNSGAGCTAAVVGPNAILTAAHCVNNGGTVTFRHFKMGSARLKSEPCQHHPGYRANQTKDFALCKVNTSMPEPWASINTDHDFVKKNDEIILTGYGCVKSNGSGADGLLRIGTATVTRLPSNNNFDIVSSSGSALCYGDSGGPAFKNGRLISVNSRGNIRDTNYCSATHMADQSFMLPWSQSKGAALCGITKSCNGEQEKPPPPKEGPAEEGGTWSKIVWWVIEAILKLIAELGN